MAAPTLSCSMEEFLSTLFLLVKNIADSMFESVLQCSVELESTFGTSISLSSHVILVHDVLVHMNTLITAVLHDFQFVHARMILDEELEFSVLLRSTAWFS